MRTLIKNGTLYDGEGNVACKADILIHHDRIARIGLLKVEKNMRVIDAQGAIVTPGFIEIGATSDHVGTLFSNPTQQDFIKNGITTIIIGNDGASLAPIINENSLAPLRKWTMLHGQNSAWKSMNNFLKYITRNTKGVNVATLVGYDTLRRAFTENKVRDLSQNECAAISEIIHTTLKEGACGISLHTKHLHTRNIPEHEDRALLKTLGKCNGVYVITKETRDPAHTLATFRALLESSVRERVSIEIAHVGEMPLDEVAMEMIINEIEKKSSRANCTYDIALNVPKLFPFYFVLPKWAQEQNIETMERHITSSHHKKELITFFEKECSHEMCIARIADPSLHFLNGKTIKEYAETRGLSWGEGLLDFLCLTKLRGMFAHSIEYHPSLEHLLYARYGFVASYGTGNLEKTKVSADKALAFIQKTTQENKISLEKAIEKLTSLPAKKFHLKKRGALKEGWYADITILKNENPSYVFVNGICALKEGELQNTKSGTALRAHNE